MRPRRPLVILAALIAALALVGCGAVAQFQAPCPAYHTITPLSWSPDNSLFSHSLYDADGVFSLFVTDLSTNNTIRLADVPAADGRPVWSPDSSRLSYLATRFLDYRGGDDGLYVTDISTNKTTMLFDDDYYVFTPFRWSPDGSKLLTAYVDEAAYECEPICYGYQLLLIEREGNQQLLPRYTFGHHDFSLGEPQFLWSPDGEHIAVTYVSYPSYTLKVLDLLVLNQQGTKEWSFSDRFPDVLFRGISWSPDGRHLLVMGSTKQTLALVDVNGTELKTLVETEAEIESVRWSRDGAWITYVTEAQPRALGVVKPDGTEHQLLATLGDVDKELETFQEAIARNDPVRWSPDGAWIAYLTDTQPRALMVVKPDGTEHKLLANDVQDTFQWLPDSTGILYISSTGNVTNVSPNDASKTVLSSRPLTGTEGYLSPDGTRIVWEVNGYNGEPDLFLMNIDGTDVHQLTHNPGNSMCFHWPF